MARLRSAIPVLRRAGLAPRSARLHFPPLQVALIVLNMISGALPFTWYLRWGGLPRFRSAQLVLMMIRQLGPHYEVAWCASSCCSLSSGRLVSMEVELLTLISRWALALSSLERSGLQRSCPVRLPSRAEIIRKSVVVRMTLHNTRVLHVFCFFSTRAVGHQVVARLMRVVIGNDGPCVSECMAPYQWLLG